MPASLASCSSLRVTAGGVITDSAVSSILLSALGEATVDKGCRLLAARNVIDEDEGLMGFTGRLWLRYQTRTAAESQQSFSRSQSLLY